MRRISAATTMILALAILVPQGALAQEEGTPIDGFTIIGVDPTDAFYPIATQPAAALFGSQKLEILQLDGQLADDVFNLRMTLLLAAGTNGYGGLGSHMWTVHFDVAGTTYLACWTVITAGTTTMSNDVEENVRGCSMFAGTTEAGPRTRAAGLQVVAEDTTWYIQWPIPADLIGGEGAVLENIVAKSWARTGSTDQPEYGFYAGDVAPNEGAYAHVLGAGGAVATEDVALGNLTIDPTIDGDVAVTANASATVGINITNFADANDTIAFVVTNSTAGWQAVLDTQNLTVAGNSSALLNITISATEVAVPEGLITIEYNSTLGVTGNFTIKAVLVESEATTEQSAALDAEPEASEKPAAAVPGVGGPMLVLAMLGVAVAVRRRGPATKP